MTADLTPHPVISVDRVTRSYRNGETRVDALRGVSVAVAVGEFVAITGSSGSGKSTLLAILGCLDRPTSGSYRLAGEEVGALSEARRARVRRERIGFVFQNYSLLPRATALENVELPLVYAAAARGVRRRRALRALAEVGLAERAGHLPSQLSGGQQQRVAVARALVTEPDVVLADEPTGNLDSGSAEDVLALLEELHSRGATLVMVTHSEEIAQRAERILRMRDGGVHAEVRPSRAGAPLGR